MKLNTMKKLDNLLIPVVSMIVFEVALKSILSTINVPLPKNSSLAEVFVNIGNSFVSKKF